MGHWIFIEEGTYRVDAAFLLTPGYTAVALEDTILEVYLDAGGERRARGSGFAVNLLLVELLEDYDEIDLLLDLGDEFKYLLKVPTISAGKVFSPDVKSLIHFRAQSPVQKLIGSDFLLIRSKLSLIDLPGSRIS
jgi:hypothetical protein